MQVAVGMMLLAVILIVSLLLAVWRLGCDYTRLGAHRMDNQRMADLIDVSQQMEDLEARTARLVRRGRGGGAAA